MNKMLFLRVMVAVTGVLLLGMSVSQAQLTASLPTLTGQINTNVTINVTAGDLTDRNVTAYQFTITYDKNILVITGADFSGTLTPSTYSRSVNVDTVAGQIRVAAAGSAPLAGSGTLVKLNARLVGFGTSALTFTEFKYNDDNATTTNGSVTVPSIVVRLPDASVIIGQAVAVALSTDDLTGKNVQSYEFQVSYDKTVVKLTGYSISGSITPSSYTIVVNADTANGRITLAAAGTAFLANAGTLITLTGTTVAPGSSPLTLASFKYNDGTPAAGTINGSVTVRGNSRPVFATVANQTVTEGDTLRFTVTATDPDNDPLTYSAGPLPTGASFTAATRTFQWVPAFGQAGTYSVKFYVTDGLLSDSTVASIEVVKKKLKPTIAAISPITKTEGDTIQIVVSATDPNPGEVLTYSTGPLPAGASFTAATRTFFWVPAFGQAGSYSVLFRVTDTDGLSDSTVASIEVLKALRVVNAIPDTVLTDGNRLYKRKLTAAPVVFDGKGTLTYTASSADPTFVEATIIAPDTLQVRGKINSGGQFITVTVTARDIDNATVSTTFRVRVDGTTEAPSVVALPKEYELAQNYPNPFNPTTVIRFALPKESPVTLEIYNILGVKVRTLIAGETMNAAVHSRVWDGRDDAGLSVPSGIYFYRLHAGEFVASRKMTLLK